MSQISVDTMTVRVPIALGKRRGRKRVLAPDGTELVRPPAPSIDSALVEAVARAFRWQRMLESGAYGTLRELATAERINPSYVSRFLRLTLLAPEVVEAILDGRR